MIPYFELKVIQLGPVPIQFWGLMVSLGFIAGAAVAARLAKKRGLSSKMVWDLLVWVIIGSILFGRLFMLFYQPEYYLSNPVKIFALWEGGESIMGGFFGAALFGLTYLKLKKVSLFKYADVGFFGLPLGLFIGRIGCFFIHDHPGTPTDFFLGVQYPDGIVRHDHGLYLSLTGLFIFLVFLVMLKRKVREGSFIVGFLILYGVIRFFLDFWRAYEGAVVETRFFSLTPAQYFSVVMVLLGFAVAWKIQKRKLPQARDEVHAS